MLYRALLRPLLYALPAETAHRLIMAGMALVSRLSPLTALLRACLSRRDPSLAQTLMGLQFPSPIALAAGMDKDAEAYQAFGALGFGAVEVGTLTAQPQPGNPQPRLFRLVPDRALINRMGFNNSGAQAAAQRIESHRGSRPVLGINIGKTKRVPAEAAVDDYVQSARRLAALADYMVVNVSSPNTPNLRDLQAVEQLRPLLARVQEVLAQEVPDRQVPLLVKIAPDLADEDVDAVADLALELGLSGIIATNTTISRQGLEMESAEAEQTYGPGGLSGAPLKQRALQVLRRLRARVGDRLVLVAAGGVETPDDAWARICAGASLVQVYTALIYEGPSLPKRLNQGLSERLRAEGLDNIAAAVGQDMQS